MALFSFKKSEILRHKKLIGRLFNEGSTFYIPPIRVFWLITTLKTHYPAQVMFTVSKRSFKHATDRNRIKRQLRESYRLNKHELYRFLESNGQQCAIVFLYTANPCLNHEELQKKIKAVFKRLFFEIDHKQNKPPITLSHQENNQS